MFQNISGQAEYTESNSNVEKKRIKLFLSNAFTKQKIFIYIISFMLSTINVGTGLAPFAISIFAAVLSNKIPALIVYILTLIRYFYRSWNRTNLNIFNYISYIYSYYINL